MRTTRTTNSAVRCKRSLALFSRHSNPQRTDTTYASGFCSVRPSNELVLSGLPDTCSSYGRLRCI